MSKVVGIFFNEADAQAMALELRAKGFEGNISLVAKKQERAEQDDLEDSEDDPYSDNQFLNFDENIYDSDEYTDTPQTSNVQKQNLTDGTATGGFIGGLAGMSIGAGSLLIPGLGPLVAMGPISGFLSGALSGGIVGALIDFGIPESEGREYEQHVRAGAILAIVTTEQPKTELVADLMRTHGAINVRTHLSH